MRPAIVVSVLALVAALAYYLVSNQVPDDDLVAQLGTGAAPESPLAVQGPTSDLSIGQSDAVAIAAKKVEADAQTYIAKLTEPDTQPIEIEKADHFITQDQVISLIPEAAIENMTLAELTADPNITANSPITLVKLVEQIEITTPERMIAESGGDIDSIVRIVEQEKVTSRTVREVLADYAKNPNKPIMIIKDVEYFEITTPAELAEDAALLPGTALQIVRKPYRLEAATVAELLRQEMEIRPDSIFYVRTVRETDAQGIWGIVHDGIVGNFSQGMAIRRGEEVNTYKVTIPKDADEALADQSSSFLGRLIYAKTAQSHVYNFQDNRMGTNPDRIYPGQEIVIINFEPEELIDIYKHFLSNSG